MKVNILIDRREALALATQRALKALADAIKDCPTCGPAQIITCPDCETRYQAALRNPVNEHGEK